MIKRTFLCGVLGMGILLTASSCIFDRREDDYIPYASNYAPVVLNRADFEKSIKFSGTKSMQKAGKIYVYNQWIFISDTNKGFHVYDNTDPEAPVLKNFIEAPGVTDMAIRNNTIYINQAVDLVALTINPVTEQVQVLKRIPNIFPVKVSPDGFYQPVETNKEVVVDWIQK